MSPELWREVGRIAEGALALPASEQAKYLERACAGSAELRAEVESLLAVRTLAEGFLETPVMSIKGTGTVSAPPSMIDQYRIVRLLGQGGMGTVYEAEQKQPHRTVALKVIREGVVDSELVRRFQQECQMLGRLRHPGIAQVYEAGVADGGFGPQPFLVMEFIRGETLLQFAEARRLTARQRLELIAKICEAVEYAHQHGIIHRDLKPGNILVDEFGQPKILDFGIARAANADAQATRLTELGQLVGTIAYMSPEQVLADPMELDKRSDVYSLGVISFELLAGRLPYNISRQQHEAVQTIREADPTPLGAISRTYRGDIERIVAKALEKEKARRYARAADLAADIRHYQNDEPIVARRPGTIYRLRKFARRHKALVASAAAIFAVLIAGTIASTAEAARAWRAEQTALRERDRAEAAGRAAARERDRALSAERKANAERNRAVTAEMRAIQERNRAVAERLRANRESAMARAVNDFLQNDLLAQASASVQARPGSRPDPELKVRTTLDRAAARITGRFDKYPLVEASIRQTIGTTYSDLGLYAYAQRQMERTFELRHRTLGKDHPDTLGTMHSLAELYRLQGKYAEAGLLFTKVLELQRRALGRKHRDTLSTMDHLALLYLYQGKYTQAEPLFAEVLQGRRSVLGEEHFDTLSTMSDLAVLYRHQGKYAEAEPLLTRVVELRQRGEGEEHPDTLTAMNNLGVVYRHQGKYAQAEPLLTKVVEERRRVQGEDHLETLASMNNLARVYEDQGKYTQAEPLLTRVLEMQRRLEGEEHPATLLVMNNLAALYSREGKYTQAEPLFTKAVELQRRVLGPEHPDTQKSAYNLALMYQTERQYTRAEPLLTKLLEIRRRISGPEHPGTTNILVSLGEIRLHQQRYAEAESLLHEALNGQERKGPDAWQRYDTQSLLGGSLAAQNKFTEAESLLLGGYQGLLQRRATIPWEYRSELDQAGERIVRLYQDWGQPGRAAEWRARLQRTIIASQH